jgi:hypothetical protein
VCEINNTTYLSFTAKWGFYIATKWGQDNFKPMKKITLFLLLFFIPTILLAADSKIPDLPTNNTVNDADLLVIEDDPGGSPETQHITVIDLFDTISTFNELDTICADKALVNKADGAVWAGVHDYGSATSFEIVNGADCSGVTGEGLMCWDSDDDLLYVGDGAAAGVVGHGNGANCAAGEIPLGVDGDGAVEGCYEPTLNDVEDPTATKTFGMGTSSLIFNFANTTGSEAFELNAIGAFNKDLFHVHQHTGNPSAGHVAVFEWEDEDIMGVVSVNNAPGNASGTNEVGILSTTNDDNDADFYPFRAEDDHDGTPDTLFQVDYIGTVITLTGFDGLGAVDLDYGSADITDHTFVTDSTGDAEIVLPNDSIGPAEIDSTTGAYDFGGVTSVELPNAAAPTTDAGGEIALDTTIADHQPLWQYFDGGENMTIIAIDTAELPATDNEIVKYNAGTDKFVLEADAGSGGSFNWVLQPQRAKLPSSNPMGIDAGNNRWRGQFDDTTDECAQWETSLRPYNGGTLSAQIDYTLETTSSSDVVEFELSIMCVTGGSPEGDAQDVDADNFGATDNISSGSITSTAGRLVTLTDSSLNGDWI